MRLLSRSLSLALLMVPLVACAHGGWLFGGKRGNGTLSTREVPVGAFEAVEAAGTLDVRIEEGDSPRVEVTVDEDLQQDVEVVVRGDRLVVDTRESIDPTRGSRVRVVVPHLREVVASGSGDVEVQPRRRTEPQLRLVAAGSGDVDFAGSAGSLTLRLSGTGDVAYRGDVETLEASLNGTGDLGFHGAARQARVSLSGTGDITLEGGEAERLEADLSGTGSLDSRRLPARDVRVDLSGTGDAEVKVAGGTAELSASGTGSITWWGHASQTRIHSSGTGDVASRD